MPECRVGIVNVLSLASTVGADMGWLTAMGMMQTRPEVAFLPAAALFACYLWSRKPVVLISALLWIVYLVYEIGVRMTCRGECNIRIDLLLIYPTLLVSSAAGVVVTVGAALRSRR